MKKDRGNRTETMHKNAFGIYYHLQPPVVVVVPFRSIPFRSVRLPCHIASSITNRRWTTQEIIPIFLGTNGLPGPFLLIYIDDINMMGKCVSVQVRRIAKGGRRKQKWKGMTNITQEWSNCMVVCRMQILQLKQMETGKYTHLHVSLHTF